MITGRNDVESLLERIQWIGNFMDIVRNGSETVYKLRNQMRISMIRRLSENTQKSRSVSFTKMQDFITRSVSSR